MNFNKAKEFLLKDDKNSNLDEVKEALKIVGNVNIVDYNENTPLHIVSYNGHLEVFKYLITNGTMVNIKNKYGQTPLHRASFNGHLEIVKYLISNDADVNSKNSYGQTPLHWASIRGHLEIVKYLILNGADVNIKNNDGYTLLHWESKFPNVKVVKYLINHGSNLNLEKEDTIIKIKELLQPTKEKILNMFLTARFLHQKYPGVAVIGNVIGNLFDPDYEFSEEELMAIAEFGTQNLPNKDKSLETEDDKYVFLYYPLSKKYPHFFRYLKV